MYVNGDPVNLDDPNGHDPHWQDEPAYQAIHPQSETSAYNPGAGTTDAGDVTVHNGSPMQTTIATWRENACLDRCVRDYWGQTFAWNPDWNGQSFWDCSPRAGGSTCGESHTYAFNGQQGWGITEYNDQISSGFLGQIAAIKDAAASDIKGALSWCTSGVGHAAACLGIGTNPIALAATWVVHHPPDYLNFQVNIPVIGTALALSEKYGAYRIPVLSNVLSRIPTSIGATVNLHNGNLFLNPGTSTSPAFSASANAGWVSGASSASDVDRCILGPSASANAYYYVGGGLGACDVTSPVNGLHTAEVGLGNPGAAVSVTRGYYWCNVTDPRSCLP